MKINDYIGKRFIIVDETHPHNNTKVKCLYFNKTDGLKEPGMVVESSKKLKFRVFDLNTLHEIKKKR